MNVRDRGTFCSGLGKLLGTSNIAAGGAVRTAGIATVVAALFFVGICVAELVLVPLQVVDESETKVVGNVRGKIVVEDCGKIVVEDCGKIVVEDCGKTVVEDCDRLVVGKGDWTATRPLLVRNLGAKDGSALNWSANGLFPGQELVTNRSKRCEICLLDL
jgi:hypothetical protein